MHKHDNFMRILDWLIWSLTHFITVIFSIDDHENGGQKETCHENINGNVHAAAHGCSNVKASRE